MSRAEWTRREVAAESSSAAEGPLLIIERGVYAVARWLHAHPGGAEVLRAAAGADATRCFVAQGHSAEARALLQRFFVGPLAEGEGDADAWPQLASAPLEPEPEPEPEPPQPLLRSAQSALAAAGPPLAVGLFAVLLYIYLF